MSHSGKADQIISNLISLNKGSRYLDLGTGYGQIGLLIKSINPFAHVTGIEIYEPYYNLQKNMKIYDEMILGNAVNEITKIIDRFDVVIGSHFIEHLDRNDALKLMAYVENWFRPSLIIFTTPLGGSPANIKDGNVHNLHKSDWYISDFKKYGYRVEIAQDLINSRVVDLFADIWYKIKNKTRAKVIVAYKRIEKFD